MIKQIMALSFSCFTLVASAQDYNKMNFDLSDEMIESNKEKAQITLLVEKEGHIVAQTSSILRNGKVYPIVQLREDGQLFGMERVKQEQELRKTNLLIQSSWHMNKDKNIWVQLFVEEFDKKIGLSNKEDEEGSGQVTQPSFEPAAIKNNFEITLSTVDDKEFKAQWGGYNFTLGIKRK